MIRRSNPDLGRILDDEDALVLRDEVGENIEQRRLARSRSSRDEDVPAIQNRRFQAAGKLFAQSADMDPVVHTKMLGIELTDSECDPIQAAWRHDSSYPAR
jgi:hypothetical protein